MIRLTRRSLAVVIAAAVGLLPAATRAPAVVSKATRTTTASTTRASRMPGGALALTQNGDLGSFFAIRMRDRAYVIPASAFSAVTPQTLSRYAVGGPAATPATSAPPVGRWPMVTLTVQVTDMSGAPFTGTAAVVNVDDADKYLGLVRVVAGRAKVSVPRGDHYVLMTGAGDRSRFALGMTPDLRVAEPTQLSLDLRTATTPVQTVLPRPAVVGAQVTDLARSAPTASGQPFTMIFSVGVDAPATILLTPVPKTRRGEISVRRQEHHDSPPRTPQRYAYDLTFVRPGSVPRSPITFRSTAANTATVVADYAGPATMPTGEVNRLVMADGGGWALTTPVRRPGRIIHYESAGPTITQGGSYVQQVTDEPPQVIGIFEGPRTQLSPGTAGREAWGRWPLHQRLSERADRLSDSAVCPACAGAGQVLFRAAPLSDTDPSHIGVSDYGPPYPVPRWTIAADGAELASGTDVAIDPVGYPEGTRVLSTRTDARRIIGGRTSRAVATWSVPVAAAQAAPTGTECPLTACRLLPAITADYRLPAAFDRSPGRRPPIRLFVPGTLRGFGPWRRRPGALGDRVCRPAASAGPCSCAAVTAASTSFSTCPPVPAARRSTCA
ncbi:MAG: hypothetical protein V9G19_22250 [Tetrasphaera sp.]